MGFNLITGTDQQTIEGLKHAIADPETGLTARLETLDEEINDEETGLAAKVSELDEQINDETTGLAAKVSELDEQINDETTGLAAKVSELDEEINDASTGLAAKVSGLDDQINATTTGLEDRVEALEQGGGGGGLTPGGGILASVLKTVALTTTLDLSGVYAGDPTHPVYLNAADNTAMSAVTDQLAINVTVTLAEIHDPYMANANGIYVRGSNNVFYSVVGSLGLEPVCRFYLLNKDGTGWGMYYEYLN